MLVLTKLVFLSGSSCQSLQSLFSFQGMFVNTDKADFFLREQMSELTKSIFLSGSTCQSLQSLFSFQGRFVNTDKACLLFWK